MKYFHSTSPFPQSECCEPFATLSLFTCHGFWYVTFLNPTTSDIYNWEPPCQVQEGESFPLYLYYANSKDFVPSGQFLPKKCCFVGRIPRRIISQQQQFEYLNSKLKRIGTRICLTEQLKKMKRQYSGTMISNRQNDIPSPFRCNCAS